MRKFVIAAVLAFISAVPAQAGQSVTLVLNWTPAADHSPFYYAKSQGWISDYYILDNINSRDGEPDVILVTRYNDFPSAAEIERRNALINERMKQDDHSADAASGQRTKMRTLTGSILYREMVKR